MPNKRNVIAYLFLFFIGTHRKETQWKPKKEKLRKKYHVKAIAVWGVKKSIKNCLPIFNPTYGNCVLQQPNQTHNHIQRRNLTTKKYPARRDTTRQDGSANSNQLFVLAVECLIYRTKQISPKNSNSTKKRNTNTQLSNRQHLGTRWSSLLQRCIDVVIWNSDPPKEI